jgi:hypothetical protein
LECFAFCSSLFQFVCGAFVGCGSCIHTSNTI